MKAQKEEIECPVCGRSHSIKDCEEFLKLGIEERSKMIFKKKLCYGCYRKVSRIHNAKYCTNRTVCTVCNDKHRTTLHGLVLRKDNSKPENQNVSGNHKDLTCPSVNMGSQVKSMSVYLLN